MKEIKINRTFESCDADDLYKYLDYVLAIYGGFLLDFSGAGKLDMEEIENILSVCMRLREKGSVIRIKNIPLTLREHFLLSGLNHSEEVITL